jgi:peptidoglycan hydrolase-like protein with peptidoglycan-binding domain
MKKIIFRAMGAFAVAAVMFSAFAAGTADALTSITISLDMGSRGASVTNLQTFLAQDTSIYPEGLITGYYGTLTAGAVRRFQARYGISTVGRVGPQTRAKINELIANGTFGQGGNPSVGDVSAPTIYNATSTLSFITMNTGTTNGTTATTTSTNGTTTTTTTTTGTQGNTIQPTVTVTWQTSEPARGKLFYSTLPIVFSEGNSIQPEPSISGTALVDGTFTNSKSFTIGNVASSTTYYYMIEAADPSGNISVTWPDMIQVR